MHKIVNGKRVPLSSEDVSQLIKDKMKWERSKAQRELEQTKEKRLKEYPSIGDQLQEILLYLDKRDDLPESLRTMIDNYKAVKTKYPIKDK